MISTKSATFVRPAVPVFSEPVKIQVETGWLSGSTLKVNKYFIFASCIIMIS